MRPLEEKVADMIRATDFDEAEKLLADGMNAYLTAINRLKPGIWPHNVVSVNITSNSFEKFKVGSRKWQAALGGTNTLYFLMAYHYGLLTLSAQAGCHYPGVSILDMPAEFAGELIEDKENFIVQPFIELLQRGRIRTGANDCHRCIVCRIRWCNAPAPYSSPRFNMMMIQ